MYTDVCVIPSLPTPLSMASLASDRTSATSPSTVGSVKWVALSLAVFKDVLVFVFQSFDQHVRHCGFLCLLCFGVLTRRICVFMFPPDLGGLGQHSYKCCFYTTFPPLIPGTNAPLLDSFTSSPKVPEAFPFSFYSFCPFFRLPHFYWPISRLTGLPLCWLSVAIEPIWLIFQFAS